MTRELERLLWMESENELGADDRRRLEELLASSETPEELRRQIASVRRVLEGLPEVRPPEELTESIDTALGAIERERVRRRQRGGWVAAWRERLQVFLAGPRRMRIAYAAAGAIIGASVILLINRPVEPLGEEYYVGALSRQPEAPLALSLPDGSVQLYREAGRLVAEVEAEDLCAVRLTLTQESSGLRLVELIESGGEAPSLSVASGSRLDLELVGPGSAKLLFEADAASQIGVRLAADSGAVTERFLSVQEISSR